MEKIHREEDDWGQDIIYVEECRNYEYEDPEKPKTPLKDLHNDGFDKICDILDVVENYFCNSGE